MITRALIINMGLFQADNNIRRTAGAYSMNYPLASNGVQRSDNSLDPGGNLTFNNLNLKTTLTMLRCSAPVTVTYTLNPVALVRPDPVTVVATVNALLLLDDNIGTFVVSNTGASPVTINFVQG